MRLGDMMPTEPSTSPDKFMLKEAEREINWATDTLCLNVRRRRNDQLEEREQSSQSDIKPACHLEGSLFLVMPIVLCVFVFYQMQTIWRDEQKKKEQEERSCPATREKKLLAWQLEC